MRKRLALALAFLILSGRAALAIEPVPGDACETGVAVNDFAFTGGRANGGIINGMFCNGSTYTGIINFQSAGNVGIGTTSPGALLDLGLAGTTLGTERLEGSTSGYVQLQPAAAAGSWTMILPGSAGTSGQFLQSNGAGITSWASATATPAGSDSNSNFGLFLKNYANTTLGTIGIFTSSPQVMLDVNGTIRMGYSGETCDSSHLGAIYYNSATSKFMGCKTAGSWTDIASGGTGLAAGSDQQIQFNNAGAFGASSGLVFNSSTGYVGIGTTGPAADLQIVDNSGGDTVVQVGPTAATSGNGMIKLVGKNSGTPGTAQIWSDWQGGLNFQPSTNGNFTYFRDSGGTIDAGLFGTKFGIGTTSPAGPLTVAPPASETIAATITANGCSTVKPVTSTAAQSTSTVDAFTNATAAGCCMNVFNVGTFTITLKHSTNFKTSGGADVSLTAGSFVPVCWDGSEWYQTAAVLTPS